MDLAGEGAGSGSGGGGADSLERFASAFESDSLRVSLSDMRAAMLYTWCLCMCWNVCTSCVIVFVCVYVNAQFVKQYASACIFLEEMSTADCIVQIVQTYSSSICT